MDLEHDVQLPVFTVLHKAVDELQALLRPLLHRHLHAPEPEVQPVQLYLQLPLLAARIVGGRVADERVEVFLRLLLRRFGLVPRLHGQRREDLKGSLRVQIRKGDKAAHRADGPHSRRRHLIMRRHRKGQIIFAQICGQHKFTPHGIAGKHTCTVKGIVHHLRRAVYLYLFCFHTPVGRVDPPPYAGAVRTCRAEFSADTAVRLKDQHDAPLGKLHGILFYLFSQDEPPQTCIFHVRMYNVIRTEPIGLHPIML